MTDRRNRGKTARAFFLFSISEEIAVTSRHCAEATSVWGKLRTETFRRGRFGPE